MSQNFLHNATFHLFLVALDQEMSQNVKQQKCPCGGVLHQAYYPRSPAGLPPPFREYYDQRLSLCCDTCRRRTTPPSVRFFGRRWFPAPLFVLISVLTLGINDHRLEQVKRHFGITVSESTWKRWRRWWRESFMTTPFWQQAKGLVSPAIAPTPSLARALLIRFEGALEEKMHLLRERC